MKERACLPVTQHPQTCSLVARIICGTDRCGQVTVTGNDLHCILVGRRPNITSTCWTAGLFAPVRLVNPGSSMYVDVETYPMTRMNACTLGESRKLCARLVRLHSTCFATYLVLKTRSGALI